MTNEQKQEILKKAINILDYHLLGPKEDSDFYSMIDKIVSEILNYTNLDEVPPELFYIVIERLKGHLIEDALLTLETQEDKISNQTIISNIKIGGVSTSYSTDDKSTLKTKIAELKSYGEKQLNRYRRICWW